MGYTTNFSGVIRLSRPLTLIEARDLLIFSEDPNLIPEPHPNSYMQWVPTETLDGIVWDENEKFYNYVEWLRWLVVWLANRGIEAVGTLRWAGEDPTDTGQIDVHEGNVSTRPDSANPSSPRPLSMEKLAKIILERLV